MATTIAEPISTNANRAPKGATAAVIGARGLTQAVSVTRSPAGRP